MAEDVAWHICWLAARGRNFLFDASLAEALERRLVAVHRRGERQLVSYVLLPGEAHVLSRFGNEDGPEALLRELSPAITRRVREADGVPGKVLARKPVVNAVRGMDGMRREVRLMACRPVVTGLRRSAAHHLRGAYGIALGLGAARGYDPGPLLQLFASGKQSARLALRKWVKQPIPRKEAHYWLLTRCLPSAAGEGLPEPLPAGSRQPTSGAARLWVEVEGGGLKAALRLLDRAVRRLFAEGNPLAPPPETRVRALVACLAVAHRLCAASAVAKHYGLARSTLSEHMAATRSRAIDRELLDTPVPRLIALAAGR